MTNSTEIRRHVRTIALLGLLALGGLVIADQSGVAAELPASDSGVAAARPTVRVEASDDQAITRAIASLPAGGGVIELGAGSFLVKHPIIIDRDGVELRGQGPETVLFLAPHANCPVVVVGSSSTPTHHLVKQITVREMLIDGNRAEQDFECYGGPCEERNISFLRNNGITVRGAESVLIENVVTRRARSGGIVLEKFCRNVRITGLDSYDNEFDGLAAYETEDSTFTHLNLHHNRSAGFSFDWRFNHNYIADTTASENGSQGIFMRDSIGNVFERVTLQSNGEQGVFMGETRTLPGTACRYNKFRSVTITGNKAQGIRINDASCTVNSLEYSVVATNGKEDISLADFGQLEVIEPRSSLEPLASFTEGPQ